MLRKCLKCNHVKEAATGDALEACPECGAIYSRVEAAVLARRAPAAQPTPPSASAPAPRPLALNPLINKGRDSEFLELLRSDSNYPTFRSVVSFFTWIGYGMAAIVAVISVIYMVREGFVAGWMGLIAAIAIFIFSRLGKEIWLMVADGCDALVRMAARQEGQ